MRLARRRFVGALLAVVLVGAGCGGGSDDDAAEDDDGIIFGSDDSSDDDSGTDDSSDDDSGTDDSGSDEASTGGGDGGDFMTVFGLPPGDATETDWSPYEYREDEFGSYESVVFEVRNTTVDDVIAHYLDALPAMGYVVDEPILLGESYAINITDPDNPLATAVVQAGETDGFITVNQNITRPVPPESTTTSEPAAASSSGEGG